MNAQKTLGAARRCDFARFVLAFVLTCMAQVCATAPSPAWADHRVLVLHSYHHGLEWSDGVQSGIDDALRQGGDHVELLTEHLDAVRLGLTRHRDLYAPLFLAQLKAKLAAMPVNAVIVVDNPALDFFLAHRNELAPGVPLVFCGINNYQPEMTAGQALVTGVVEAPSFTETLETAMRLFPRATKLLVLGEDSVTFRSNQALLEKALERMPSPPEIQTFISTDIDAIEARVAQLGPQWLVLPMMRPGDHHGLLPLPEAGARLSNASPVPLLAGWDFMMGHGALGGKVVSATAQGQAAGKMALDILAGQDPAAIPVMTDSPNRFIFDHSALVRFNVDASQLPPGSRELNHPSSFYEDNRTLVWTYLGFTFLLLLCLVVLAVNIMRRSNAERRLQGQFNMVNSLLEAIPNPLFLKDAQGVYKGCNKAFEALLGLPRNDIIGRTVFDLAKPEIARAAHSIDMGILATGIATACELPLQTSSGELTFLFNKAPYLDADGNTSGLVTVLTDLTERKQAEAALRESEEKHRALFETMTHGVVYMNSEGSIISSNPAAERILGLSLEQMQGRTSMDPRWQSIHENGEPFPAKDHPTSVAMDTGKIIRDAVMGVFNPVEDRYRWIRITATPEFYPGEDKPHRVYAIFEDVTASKQAEEALRESEAKFRRVLGGMLEGYVNTTLEGTITEYNPAYRDMLGYSDEELRLLTYQQVTPAKWHEQEARIIDELVMERGYSDFYEKEYISKDGTIVPVELRTYLLCDSRGNPVGLWAFVRDISERRHMQETMVQNEKMMSVGGLAAGMAHEINNPLSGILQSAQVMSLRLKDDLPANRAQAEALGCDFAAMSKYLEQRGVLTMLVGIRESAARAARIVANMLDFSRRGDGEKMPFDLNVLLDAAIELCASDYDLQKKHDFRHIELKRDYDTGLPPVPCTPTQIEQVVMNILRNAAQAMANRPADSPPARIALRTRREGGMARIDIEDNGPGMDETTRKRIFEPFFTTKKPGDGTGLGLSVSYYIISNNHDGALEVESSPGLGTRFVIRLPLQDLGGGAA